MTPELVFVTGASSGLGRALAERAPGAARVIGVSRRPTPGIESCCLDLSEPDSWQALAERMSREIEGFSGARIVLFHAAGTLTPIGFAGEVDPAGYRRQVLLNAACPLVVGDAFLRASRRSDAPAHLVMISSGAARHVYEGWSAYGAGKAAVDHWVRTVGAEQQRRGGRCRVLSVAPGIVSTPMQEEIRRTPERDFPSRSRFVELHRQGALRDPEEVSDELWRLLDEDLPNGAVIDLRERAGARS